MKLENLTLSTQRVESDYDTIVTEITLIPANILTKAKFKEFYSLLRSKYKDYIHYGFCGHEYDCCGCATSERNTIIFSKDSTKVINEVRLNY